MRILLDTNIWLASLLTRGVCQELVEHCLEKHTLLSSEFIIKEVKDKLTDKFKFPANKIRDNLSFIKRNTESVPTLPILHPICRDQDDDWILSAAFQGQVDCLLTGDKDLLVLKKYENIPILKPNEFWEFESKFSINEINEK